MKTYFKALFLLLLVFSCSPEEIDIKRTLITIVKPVNSGTIARTSISNNDNVQLYAIPLSDYVFKGWYYDDNSSSLDINNPIYILMDADKVVTAVFEKKDTDGDGVADDIDDCPDTPSGEAVDANGCSDSQTDGDGDGVMNDIDLCANTPEDESVDADGCSDSQKDTDEDGITDNIDLCPNTRENTEVNLQGCPNNGFSNDINMIVPQDILDKMVDIGFEINLGDTPPSIEGIYRISPFILIGSNRFGDIIGDIYADLDFKYSSQDNSKLNVNFDYINGPDSGTGLGSFMSGNGNKFTTFTEIESLNSGHKFYTIQAISGEKTNDGIINITTALFMADDKGDPNNNLIENGDGRVFNDGDGLAVNISSLGAKPAGKSPKTKLKTALSSN